MEKRTNALVSGRLRALLAVPLVAGLGTPTRRRPVRLETAAPRNAPCQCGSGKKYKACCRAADMERSNRS